MGDTPGYLQGDTGASSAAGWGKENMEAESEPVRVLSDSLPE